MTLVAPQISNPVDLLLDTNGDLVVGSDLSFSSGINAVAQSCLIAIQMIMGEWFLNLNVGIPYFDGILGEKPSAAIAVAQISINSALLACDYVTSVEVLKIAYVGSSRSLNITWQVMTSLGLTPVDTLTLSASGELT